jgi:hypothetical protein
MSMKRRSTTGLRPVVERLFIDIEGYITMMKAKENIDDN